MVTFCEAKINVMQQEQKTAAFWGFGRRGF
jgi:hypothetical protein